MKRVWGHVLVGVGLIGSSGVIVSACAHDDSTMFIRDVLALQLVTNGQVCTYSADPAQTYISSGILDIDFTDDYTAEFLVGNQILPRGSSDQSRAETSLINVQGAVVRITDSAGNQLTTYTRLAAATIDPAVGGTPSYTPIALEIVDHDTVASVVPQVAGAARDIRRLVTFTQFFGTTLGGQSVESNEFEFPVDVCRGCLIQFAPQDINPDFAKFGDPNCVGNSALGTSQQLPVPCIRGQDLPVDCSQCQEVADCQGPGGGTATDAGTD